MQQFMTLDNSSLEKIAGGENGGLWSIIGFWSWILRAKRAYW